MTNKNSHNDQFLTMLTEITEANLTNEQFGVSELAKEMGMSRSNLHRKVIFTTKTSVSQFIRQYRLKRAMEMLRQTSVNVSEVAYKVGFGSVTYFTKCFGDYYGFPPGEVGKRNLPETEVNVPQRTNKKRTVLLLSVFLILATVTILFFIFNPFNKEEITLEKSIAVLPFIDDSPDEGNTYIINGLREEILNKIEKIKDFKVVSRTTSENYRDSKKSVHEIAEELQVNYILEGSGQKIGNRIKITLQLIETETDKHLWSHPYMKEVGEDKIFELQEDVAFAVAAELKTILSQEEKEQIIKKPTENLAAYDYYLKGSELLLKGESLVLGGKDGTDILTEAIMYFEKALDHDKQFALAYAELARAYFFLEFPKAEKQYSLMINNAADKAMLYDPQLEMSFIAKALYYFNVGEMELVVSYLNKALQYNPNSGTATSYLSYVYSTFMPDTEQFLENALRAVKLKIQANNNNAKSQDFMLLCAAFRQAGFFDEAEIYIKKSLDINPDNISALIEKSQLFAEIEGDYQQSLETLLEIFNNGYRNTELIRLIGVTYYYLKDYDKAYKYATILDKNIESLAIGGNTLQGGRVGILLSKMGMNKEAEEYFSKYMDYAKTTKNFYKSRHLAAIYSYRNDTENALEQMKIFSEQENYPHWVVRSFKDDPLFDNIRNLPEFKEILSEIETKFWANHERIKASLEEKGLL